MILKKRVVFPFLTVILLQASTEISFSQVSKQKSSGSYLSLNWKELASRVPSDWYGTAEARSVADSVVKYQTDAGGWIKNTNFHKGLEPSVWAQVKTSGIGATFDNGATITEMNFLAKMYSVTKDNRYRDAFRKGFSYILKAQYQNGGWPQFYPARTGNVSYSAHITYNDNAMINIMKFLKDVLDGSGIYAPLQLNKDMMQAAQVAFNKGVECILKTQIKIDGKPTVWCAQHDEVTMRPANARAYELASFSGAESAEITMFLMDLPNPDAAVKTAVAGAVKWFEGSRIQGIKLQSMVNAEGQKDKEVIKDSTGKSLWARFYDLETGAPFFCDRDGIKRKTFAELGYNRRNGYSWYSDSPEKVIIRYAKWAQQYGLN